MSDIIVPVDSGQDLPEWLARLREGRFVSPSGTESRFLFDQLTRSIGKKASAHEIADSNDSVLQDLGNATRAYPMDVYFVGASYDQQADAFVDSLLERYTPDAPGILHHPRWGDVPVMPFSLEHTERFTGSGVGIARVQIEFRETKSLTYPRSDALTQAEIRAAADELQAQMEAVADEMDVDTATAYSRFRAGMRGAIGAVSGAVDGVQDQIQGIQDEVDAITQDILGALDLAASPAQIMGQLGALVFGVADVVMSLPDRVGAYIDMTVGVIDSYVTRFNRLVSATDKKNVAQSLEAVGGIMAAASAVAALNTDYETREDVGAVVDGLVSVMAAYREGLDAVGDDSVESIGRRFIADHDVQSTLYGIIAATNRLALERAFNLRTKRVIVLDVPSDALTLTWEYYRDLGEMEFFMRTNRITGGEFVEIPAGREIVIYV